MTAFGLQWVAKGCGSEADPAQAWPLWSGCSLGPATVAREGSTSNSGDKCKGGGVTSDAPMQTMGYASLKMLVGITTSNRRVPRIETVAAASK